MTLYLQLCARDKEDIEFVKNGLDVVVKKSADDYAKKMKELEKRSEKAFKSTRALYFFFIFFFYFNLVYYMSRMNTPCSTNNRTV